jgi:hypothetical protein
MGELRYSSTIFFTSAVVRGEWSAPRPSRITAGKEPPPRYRLDRRLRWSQTRSGRCEEEKVRFPLPGIEPRPFCSLRNRGRRTAIQLREGSGCCFWPRPTLRVTVLRSANNECNYDKLQILISSSLSLPVFPDRLRDPSSLFGN